MRHHRFFHILALIGAFVAALASAGGQGARVAFGSAQETAGYSDFTFKASTSSNTPATPTADKPQSKLWFNDGFWWASMFNKNNNPRPAFHIYRLDIATQSWNDTGTELDSRVQSQGDFLWDNAAQKLYMVSGNTGLDGWYMRFSYDANQKKYTKTDGPIVVRSGGAESISLDKDTTGKLWITYTRGNQVYANRTTTSETVWGTPFIIPGATTLNQDDISGIVAYRGNIGVIWSNHDPNNHSTPTAVYFSYHQDGDPDTSWHPIETIYASKCAADDHINIKSIQADSDGTIFAALKTSFGDDLKACGASSSSAQIRLVVRKSDGTWTQTTFGTVADDHTRPIVMLDTTNRKVYVFATSPTTGNGSVYMKSTSMDNPDFSNQPGQGTPFIKSSTYTDINNATSTKQTVDAYSGLVVLAADETKDWYLHNYISLGTPTPRLVFKQQPGNTAVGMPFAAQPIITAQNAQGQKNTSFNGPITLAIKAGTGTSGATLAGTVTVNAVAGEATFSGLTINMAGANYQLTASAGNGYADAISTAFTIEKTTQTITIDPIPQLRYGDPPFELNATSSSGLAVSFSDPVANDACTIAGGTIQITNVGSCTIRASQSGDANTNAATIDKSIAIAKGLQTISFGKIVRVSQHTFQINVSASSGLSVALSVSGPCTLSGTRITFNAAEPCIVEANQAGNSLYNPADPASEMVTNTFFSYLSLIQH